MKYECGSHLVPPAPVKLAHCPHSLAANLAALPFMSFAPLTPFDFILLFSFAYAAAVTSDRYMTSRFMNR
jgi:uncharacterized protein (DUF2062 family)